MKQRKQQSGFTLIELVIVIVILGILAATAAPKFIDLQGDARGATFQAVKASVESATSIVHAKALIQNQVAATGTVSVNGNPVTLAHSWPNSAAATWTQLLELDAASFKNVVDAGNDRIFWYTNDGGADLNATQAAASNCYVSYTESTDSNVKPVISVVVTGCK